VEKIINIIESIAHEKGLKMSEAKEAVSTALIRTAQKVFGEEYDYAVTIDEKKKELNLFQKVLVVDDNDERLEENTEEGEKYIAVSEAKEADSEVEVGDEITYQLSLDNMGRTAAAILYKELEYHIQRLLEQNIFE
jgi:N utilization substance protein A